MDVPTQKQAAPTNPESSGPHKSTNNQMQIAHALSSPTVCFITVAQKKYIIPSLVTGLTYNCAGILVLWLLVGYWWDEVQKRWDPSHFMPSQTPTNHPSQFFWHCHNSVPKWKVSNKIIFERIIESKSFILNQNLAFICQLFGNWQGESVKKRIFYGQGQGGGQPSRPWP